MQNQRNDSMKARVVQQPIQCRVSGYNLREVRTIDPPPVVELVLPGILTQEQLDIFRFQEFVCYVSLWSSDGLIEITENSRHKSSSWLWTSDAESTSNSASSSFLARNAYSVLVGDRISICHYLPRMSSIPAAISGCFFAFPDIAVKSVGTYRLQFQVYDIVR